MTFHTTIGTCPASPLLYALAWRRLGLSAGRLLGNPAGRNTPSARPPAAKSEAGGAPPTSPAPARPRLLSAFPAGSARSLRRVLLLNEPASGPRRDRKQQVGDAGSGALGALGRAAGGRQGPGTLKPGPARAPPRAAAAGAVRAGVFAQPLGGPNSSVRYGPSPA